VIEFLTHIYQLTKKILVVDGWNIGGWWLEYWWLEYWWLVVGISVVGGFSILITKCISTDNCHRRQLVQW